MLFKQRQSKSVFWGNVDFDLQNAGLSWYLYENKMMLGSLRTFCPRRCLWKSCYKLPFWQLHFPGFVFWQCLTNQGSFSSKCDHQLICKWLGWSKSIQNQIISCTIMTNHVQIQNIQENHGRIQKMWTFWGIPPGSFHEPFPSKVPGKMHLTLARVLFNFDKLWHMFWWALMHFGKLWGFVWQTYLLFDELSHHDYKLFANQACLKGFWLFLKECPPGCAAKRFPLMVQAVPLVSHCGSVSPWPKVPDPFPFLNWC
jgi:hypothetical protein